MKLARSEEEVDNIGDCCYYLFVIFSVSDNIYISVTSGVGVATTDISDTPLPCYKLLVFMQEYKDWIGYKWYQ